MRPMVAVHASPDGVRISKITEHGEQVVVPDLEARVLAVKLWALVTAGELQGHSAVFKELEDLVKKAEQTYTKLDTILRRLDKAVAALEKAAADLAPKLVVKPPVQHAQ